jgi:hypothetical protein
MKKIFSKIKEFFKELFSNKDIPIIAAILVSSYYIGLGIMLAIYANSVVVLLAFAVPAIVWYISTLPSCLITRYEPSY